MAVGALITADRIIALKTKIKNECARRSLQGSVAAYAGTAYDFTTTPAKNGLAKKEHYEKLVIPMNAINSANTPTTAGIISDANIQRLETNVVVYATRSQYDKTASDCSSSCTGLCYTTCSGSCSGGCSGCTSCSGGCSGCTNCSGGCSGGCTGYCVDTCADLCGGQCTSCVGGCGGTCQVGCVSRCDGCTNCSGGCSGGCSGSCSGGCRGCTSCSGCTSSTSW